MPSKSFEAATQPGIRSRGELSRPAGISCRWIQAHDAADTADNSGSAIDDPSNVANFADRLIGLAMGVGGAGQGQDVGGTFLRASMLYPQALSVSTQCVIQVFGRHDPDEPWQRLANNKGEVDITLTAAGTDVKTGSSRRTRVDPDDHSIDVDGCREFLVAVKQALAGTGGDASEATIELKLL